MTMEEKNNEVYQ